MVKRLRPVLLLALVACGPDVDRIEPTIDAGPNDPVRCSPGEAPRCAGTDWMTCSGGFWVAEDCTDVGVCANNLGCRTCRPDDTYCVGQDVYLCASDGNSGTYQETCGWEQQCATGECLSPCAAIAEERTNVGCEFWPVDLPSDYQCQSMDGGATCMFGDAGYGCAQCQQFAVVVANMENTEVLVTIEQNNAAPGEPLDLQVVTQRGVPGNSLGRFDLPMREVDCTQWYTDSQGHLRRGTTNSDGSHTYTDTTSCLSSRAYRLTASHPVVAYQFNPIENEFSNAASLLIPTNGLDVEYHVMSYSTANPIALDMPGQTLEGIPDYMNLTLVGVYPNTTVEVTVTHKIQGSPDGVIPETTRGNSFTATIGPFDVLNIETIQELLGDSSGDLTGTRVVANLPVVAYSGGQRSLVPGVSLDDFSPRPPEPSGDYDVCCTEHFEQQLFPTSALGWNFVITRSPPRSTSAIVEPDFIRVLATGPGTTTITTGLTEFPTFTLSQGEYRDFWATVDFTLQATQPIMIAQYAVCEGFIDQGGTGDPEFILFAPVEQFRPEYIFLTPTTFDDDWVIIAAPNTAFVTIDGEQVSDEFNPRCNTFPVGTLASGTYVAIRCPVDDGPHKVESSEPVGITVYGYYSVGSYGYPGGADMKQINVE